MKKRLLIVITALFVVGLIESQTENHRPEIALAKIIGNGNKTVVNDVQLYLSDKDAYKLKHKGGLEEYGFDGAYEDSFDLTFVIIEGLKSINHVAIVDWREDAQYAFDLLNDISKNTLSTCSILKQLEDEMLQNQFNISYYLETNESGFLFSTCAKSIGLEIIGIDDGSDMFNLSLVPIGSVSKLKTYSQQLKLKIKIYDNRVTS